MVKKSILKHIIFWVSITWFHMNWGWGGQNNGWFGYASADSGNLNFQYKRDMVYSIYK
jgi:hypothetical protein